MADSTTDRPAGDSGEVREVALPADTSAPTVARGYVTAHWPQLSDELLGDVQLIVTELASNAVRHGNPDFALRMRVAPFAVDIAVLDHGTDLPTARDALATDESGRGLRIIEALADGWGVERLDDGAGKYVWASRRVA